MKYTKLEITKGNWTIKTKSLFPCTYANIEIIFSNEFGEMKGEFCPDDLESLIELLKEINTYE